MAIEEAFYTATDGRELFYRHAAVDAPKGGVLLVHGYAEHSGRYTHVIDAFTAMGLTVFAPDHRGHGRSALTLGDLESVDQVVEDLNVLRGMLRDEVGEGDLFVVGHSMGGMLSTLLLQRFGSDFTGAILNGAALQVPDDVPVVVQKLAGVLGKITPHLGVQPFYDPEHLSHNTESNDATRTDPLFYRGKIRARTGAEMLKGLHAALDNLDAVQTPVLVTHGKDDATVPPAASQTLFDQLRVEDKTLHWFEGMLHEVLNEPDHAKVLELYTGWMSDRLS